MHECYVHANCDSRYCDDQDIPLAPWERALLFDTVSAYKVEAYAVALTVYTSVGTFTVENVREDSIRVVDSVLTAESANQDMRLFTFYGVGGYSTIIPSR